MSQEMIPIYALLLGVAVLSALEWGEKHLERKREAGRRAHYDQLYAMARAEDSEE